MQGAESGVTEKEFNVQAAQLEKEGGDRLRSRCAELEERWAAAEGRADAAGQASRRAEEKLRETEAALQVTRLMNAADSSRETEAALQVTRLINAADIGRETEAALQVTRLINAADICRETEAALQATRRHGRIRIKAVERTTSAEALKRLERTASKPRSGVDYVPLLAYVQRHVE